MIDLSVFPVINACLNGTSAVLLGTGYYLVKQRRLQAHKRFMIAALVTSALFLVSYLTYHWELTQAGRPITRFQGQGIWRPIYFAILGTHTVLAAVIVPLVLVTVTRALRGKFDLHRAVARWTFPLWMYVSVTGVIIYLMLYQIFAP
jgi:uncharacterized membrane protein YozB (DUF420 family)